MHIRLFIVYLQLSHYVVEMEEGLLTTQSRSIYQANRSTNNLSFSGQGKFQCRGVTLPKINRHLMSMNFFLLQENINFKLNII